MKKIVILTAAVLLCMGATASADFSDNFDSYLTGSLVQGQGGWEGWGGDNAYGGPAVSTHASSLLNSVEIGGNFADLVHPFSGYTSGTVFLTSDLYVPSSSDSGDSYWIWLNQYSGGFNWSIQVQINLTTGQIVGTSGSTGGGTFFSTPIVYDQWVQLKAIVNLDANSYDCLYGSAVIADNGVWYGNAANVAAIDLFSNGATTPVYFDNVAITTPEPVSMALVGVGGVAMFIRRRRHR